MMELVPYLNFDGTCREAMTFYHKCIGGNLQIKTYGETDPSSAPDARNRVIHAQLTNGSIKLMASDTMLGAHGQKGNNIQLSVTCDSDAEVDSLYAAFSEGGTGTMPPSDTFWNARFAMLTDRFGMHWMFNHEHAPQG